MKSDSEGVDDIGGPHGSEIVIKNDTNKINKRKYSLYGTEDYTYPSEDEESEDDTEDYMYEGEDEDSKDDTGYNDAITYYENEVREVELAIAKRYRKTEESSKVVDEDKEYLIFKKQFDLLSTKIKSPEDAESLINGKEIVIVGVFPEFIGEEFENFMVLANKLHRFYSFAHTHDAKILPGGEAVDKPTLRLFQPFDKRFVDSQDFQVDIMKKFIEEATTPVVTVWNKDPKNQPYIHKFLYLSKATAMLFVSFSKEHDLFQPKYKEIAEFYRGKGISFMLCDADVIRDYTIREFGVKKEQAPVLVIKDADGKMYPKGKIEPSQIESWMNDYMDNKIEPFIRRPGWRILETNCEPVKVVVSESLQDMVFGSGKNVLLEFFAPRCGRCKQLAPILEEVAIFLENDPYVIIAKFDASVNDVPSETFDVKGGFPSVYFKSASGNLLKYEGDSTKEDIIDFIQKNKDKPKPTAQSISVETRTAHESESVITDCA